MASKKKASGSRRRKVKVIVFAVEIVVLLIVLAALYVSLKLSKLDSEELDEEVVERNELSKETEEVIEGYTTIAIFGLDNRSNGSFNGGNSDMIMVASIDNKTKEVKLASIYRDTYLNMTNGDGYNKANAAYALGGPEQAVSMLNVNWDLNISEYVSVDFNAVIEAVDTLGGVELTVNELEAEWMNIYLNEMAEFTGKSADYVSPGTYNMNGMQATAYARVRATAGDDYKRTERQREVVEKMMKKALASDMGTINKLIDKVFPEVKTSLSQTEILSLAKDAFSYSLGETNGFPVDKGTTVMSGAGDSVIPLDLASNVAQLHKFLYDAEDYEVSESVKKISNEIVNASGMSKSDLLQ